MAYDKKIWIDRLTEHPTRRKLEATGTTDVYDVSRQEGLVTAEGDAFSATNMNDLEDRVEEAVNAAQTTANAALPKAGGTMTGNLVAYSTNRSTIGLRNAQVQNSAGSAVSTNYLVFRRA